MRAIRSNVFIEEMKPEDLDEVLLIERSSFPSPWPRRIFEMELKTRRSFKCVSRVGGAVAGYIIAWIIYDEGHILNVAVHPDFRRLGIGEALMRECLGYFTRKSVKYAILEVRRSNLGAITLYEKLGFNPVGVRKSYYSDTEEDAIVMMLDFE
ncbi:MAG: ribosomal protein S18-alanine N-acetyltransferase [Deltaproteobacteria bacterium]